MARTQKKPTLEKLLETLTEVVRETAPPACTTPDEAYLNILKHFDFQMCGKKECFVMLGLDGRRRIIHHEVVSIGTMTATLVHPREVFKSAILHDCSSILVAHNHPSGDPTPSHEDRLLTERLVQAGQLLGINLDDHLVIGKGCFTSLRRLGLLV